MRCFEADIDMCDRVNNRRSPAWKTSMRKISQFALLFLLIAAQSAKAEKWACALVGREGRSPSIVLYDVHDQKLFQGSGDQNYTVILDDESALVAALPNVVKNVGAVVIAINKSSGEFVSGSLSTGPQGSIDFTGKCNKIG